MSKADTSDGLLPWLLLGVFSFCLLVASPALNNDFVFDDTKIIAKNPLIHGPLSVGAIFVSNYWQGASEQDPLYRPLTILSFALQNAVTGISPGTVLAVNILLYALCSTLLSIILLRAFTSHRFAVLAGLFFASMPIHAEVFANGVGRAELLAAFFSLVGIERFLALVRGYGSGTNLPLRPRLGLTISMLCYVLAMLSKETAVTTPLLLFLVDRCAWRIHEESLMDLLREYVFIGIGAGIYLAMRNTVVGMETPQAHELLKGLQTSERLTVSASTTLSYLKQSLVPSVLLADYHDYRQLAAPSLHSARTLLELFTLGAILLAALASLLVRPPVVFLALAWFFVALLPTSNALIPIGVVQADRLAFFPSIGLSIGLAWCVHSCIFRSRLLGMSLMVSILLWQSISTIQQARIWRNRETLWNHVIAYNPGSPDAWRNKGDTYFEKGSYDDALAAYKEAKRLRAARGIFDRAATLLIAKTYHRMGKLDEAASQHLEILQRNPNHLVSAITLGQLYLEDPRFYSDALRVFRFAVARHPHNPHAKAHEAEALKRLGQNQEALAAIDHALNMEGNWPYMALIKAEILDGLGKHAQADALRTEVREPQKALNASEYAE